MRESPFEIKALTPDRVPECVDIILTAAKTEFDKTLPPPDPAMITAKLEDVARKNCLIGYVNNDQICGFLAIEIDCYWWSKQPVLQDIMFIVKPEFRSYSAFNRLLSVAEEFAKLNKVPIALSFFVFKDLAKKGKLIMKRGYKPVSWTMFRG